MYTVASGTQFSIALGDGPFISLYYPILSIWILQIIVIFTIAINTDNWTVATFDWIFSFTQWRGKQPPAGQTDQLPWISLGIMDWNDRGWIRVDIDKEESQNSPQCPKTQQ